MPWYAILGLIYIVTHMVSLVASRAAKADDPYGEYNFPFLTPKIIYRTTEMNWLGCIVVYLIYFSILPVWAILRFIWWLFHVKRD